MEYIFYCDQQTQYLIYEFLEWGQYAPEHNLNSSAGMNPIFMRSYYYLLHI